MKVSKLALLCLVVFAGSAVAKSHHVAHSSHERHPYAQAGAYTGEDMLLNAESDDGKIQFHRDTDGSAFINGEAAKKVNSRLYRWSDITVDTSTNAMSWHDSAGNGGQLHKS